MGWGRQVVESMGYVNSGLLSTRCGLGTVLESHILGLSGCDIPISHVGCTLYQVPHRRSGKTGIEPLPLKSARRKG